MHTVELLEEALEVAERCGFKIRHEWLGSVGGGLCEFGGQKWLFVDLSLNAIEQLEQVSEALRQDASIHTLQISRPLRQTLRLPLAA